LMSAVMPAPDEGSNPAIVRTTGGVILATLNPTGQVRIPLLGPC
jgi:hypothetical protein